MLLYKGLMASKPSEQNDWEKISQDLNTELSDLETTIAWETYMNQMILISMAGTAQPSCDSTQ